MARDGEERLVITPETRIGPLLEVYPNLEATLIELAPAFAKLRHPILRKTVARVTTLRQAARVGRVPLGTLINTLRRAAGDRQGFVGDDAERLTGGAPDWFETSRIRATVDGRPIIEAGEHPLAHVMPQLAAARPGEILELITPFVPEPLIEKMKASGYRVWCDESEPDCVHTYLGPAQK